jgi:lipopolysaccharide export system permease protein
MFGLMTSLASFALNEAVVPVANRTSKRLEFVALYKAELPSGQANFTYMERGKDLNIDRIFFIGYYEGRNLANVIILDFTRDKLVQIISAAEGLWTNGEWLLKKGRTYVLAGDSDITRIMRFDELKIPGLHNVQKALEKGNVSPKEMNMFELSNYLTVLKNSNAVSNDLLVRYYQKVSQPLACLIVSLAGAPLGLLARRSRSNLGLIYSAVVVFLYYVLQSSSGALGEAGRITPILAAWLPNIVIGILGLTILYNKAK